MPIFLQRPANSVSFVCRVLTTWRSQRNIQSVFSLGTHFEPAFVMDMVNGDKAKGMLEPVIYPEYEKICGRLGKEEHVSFYEQVKKAHCVIQTGEER